MSQWVHQHFLPREPWPDKILSKATIFARPALARTPCCTEHRWWQGVSSMISRDNLSSTYPFILFYEPNMSMQHFCVHRKCQTGKQNIFSCHSHSLEDESDAERGFLLWKRMLLLLMLNGSVDKSRCLIPRSNFLLHLRDVSFFLHCVCDDSLGFIFGANDHKRSTCLL